MIRYPDPGRPPRPDPEAGLAGSLNGNGSGKEIRMAAFVEGLVKLGAEAGHMLGVDKHVNGPKSALAESICAPFEYSALEYSEQYSEEFMARLAKTGDPLADDVIARMAEEGLLKGAWRDLVDVVTREAETRGGIYAEFIDQVNRVPDWVDFDLMKPSQRMIFTKIPNLLMTGMITFFGCAFLPRGMSVAASSEFLRQGKPRLIESGTFILKPALGLEPGSMAHHELVRVRIIHGAIRFFMGQKRGENPGDQQLGDDEYVSQTQMAYFLTSFSYLHLRTSLLLGIKLTDEQMISHQHRWRYMGFVMGISEELLTEDLHQERVLAMSALKHEANPEYSHPFFLEMIQEVLGQLSEGKSQEFKDALFTEFRAMLLYSLGEDFVGGWAGSMSEPGMRDALHAAQQKIAFIDSIQRIKPVEMLQHFVVRRQFLSQRKKLLLNIETSNAEDALGDIENPTQPENYEMFERFRDVIGSMQVV